MSDVPSPNPYSAPNTLDQLVDRGSVAAPGSEMQTARSLAGWQLFFAIFSFLCVGLVVLYATLMVALGARGVVTMGVVISFMIIFALGYVVVGLVLLWASTSARRFANTPTVETLTEMMKGQRVLWGTLGVLTIVAISLWVLSMLLNFMVFF